VAYEGASLGANMVSEMNTVIEELTPTGASYQARDESAGGEEAL
jgi:hypothetical protein